MRPLLLSMVRLLLLVWSLFGDLEGTSASFIVTTAITRTITRMAPHRHNAPPQSPKQQQPRFMASNNNNDNKNNKNTQQEDDRIMEESRLKIWNSRRQSIRSTLKLAEQIRTVRLAQNWIPALDETTGKPKPDGKAAVTLTAFGVAAGAVALRLGGRAALVSAIGLDFAKDNPELKDQLDQVIQYANDMNFGTEALVFVAAWTAVKVFCFDAGGIVLALASGILFGGVFQGALASATAATIGSSVCFLLAKLDTPVRKKALEIVEEYPSLRGIEKVVAQDGFKAILTLRLAPILPIPLGLYNYVYGVTNVPFGDFASGIFLGSFKPYLLDSYLGYFGKSVMDGSAGDATGYQDIILLLALGLSVLIGVFASQLAGETWDVVLEEVEAERKAKLMAQEGNSDKVVLEGLVTTQVAGVALPEWMIDWQINWGMAEERMMALVQVESQAKVWNYTTPELIPRAQNPALDPSAPELTDMGQGVDLQKSVLDGLVLSPVLFSTFTKHADPFYQESDDETMPKFSFADLSKTRKQPNGERNISSSLSGTSNKNEASTVEWQEILKEPTSTFVDTNKYLGQLELLRSRSQRRLDRLESILQQENNSKAQ
jgi:uncharacterized membrane protein YdjX (TVP38/TMEM64 family)